MTDQHHPDPFPLGSGDLPVLRSLLLRAVTSTENPSWQRTFREAEHVVSLLEAAGQDDQPDADELRRRLAEIRSALDHRAAARAAARDADTPVGTGPPADGPGDQAGPGPGPDPS